VKVLFIAGRELSALLGSVVGWLVLTAFLTVSGLVFVLGVIGYLDLSEQVILSPIVGAQLTFADYLLWPFFSFQALFLLFLVPGLTMRLISEELRNQTLELLLTSPVSLWEIVLGKFVGAATFLAVMLLGTAWAPISLLVWSTVDPAQLLLGYLATWLAGSAMIALGMAFSATTSHQVLALVLAEGVAFVLLLLTAFADSDPTGLAAGLAMTNHMEDLVRGVVRLSDIGYFLAFIGFFLLATQQRLAMRRWA
jgi:ABC-2 type transport system permease protein